jgi:lipopolysaccharide/colanic/teichoic acid biosynthesis glycosyltransferase
MFVDAERGTGPVWAADGDPRVTAFGRFLRATHLDELPQLWNVLRGDMSLVGPRPERPTFVDGFVGRIPGYADRHAVRPGITGLAQVRQGYDTCERDVRRKVRLDLLYIRRRGVVTDLRILIATALAAVPVRRRAA